MSSQTPAEGQITDYDPAYHTLRFEMLSMISSIHRNDEALCKSCKKTLLKAIRDAYTVILTRNNPPFQPDAPGSRIPRAFYNPTADLIDIRTTANYPSVHIEDAMSVLYYHSPAARDAALDRVFEPLYRRRPADAADGATPDLTDSSSTLEWQQLQQQPHDDTLNLVQTQLWFCAAGTYTVTDALAGRSMAEFARTHMQLLTNLTGGRAVGHGRRLGTCTPPKAAVAVQEGEGGEEEEEEGEGEGLDGSSTDSDSDSDSGGGTDGDSGGTGNNDTSTGGTGDNGTSTSTGSSDINLCFGGAVNSMYPFGGDVFSQTTFALNMTSRYMDPVVWDVVFDALEALKAGAAAGEWPAGLKSLVDGGRWPAGLEKERDQLVVLGVLERTEWFQEKIRKLADRPEQLRKVEWFQCMAAAWRDGASARLAAELAGREGEVDKKAGTLNMLNGVTEQISRKRRDQREVILEYGDE